MGKLKNKKLKKLSRHGPLDEQISAGRYAKASTRIKKRKQREDEEFLDNKLSRKILEQAKRQQDDLGISDFNRGKQILQTSQPSGETSFPILGESSHPILEEPDLDSDADDEDVKDSEFMEASDFIREVEIDEEDEKAMELFMCKDPVQRATLADFIKDKLTEKQTEIHTIFSDVGTLKPDDLKKIAPLYKGVAVVLSRYRSGKLPKAFKAIPKFTNWEHILHLTEPDNWSAGAMFQATKVFTSNLKEKMAQRFLNLVLLPRIRDDIKECKMLNFHLYVALQRSLFKPGAFYKGIILPLCESGTCTLREATIIGSVISKSSIPVLHSCAALLKIAEMDYTGASSIFMRILLEKKYALPFRVVDAVVAHFLRFATDKRKFPLLWHQCLLTFAQIYKNDMSSEQKAELVNLTKIHSHIHVSPEIRKELDSSSTTRKCAETMVVEQSS